MSPVRTASTSARFRTRAHGERSRSTFACSRERDDYSWSDCAVHLSGRTAERFCLGDRGRLAPGYAADVLLIDPMSVTDQADYDSPRRVATGIDDVFVNGQHVLEGRRLTGTLSGLGLRRSALVR